MNTYWVVLNGKIEAIEFEKGTRKVDILDWCRDIINNEGFGGLYTGLTNNGPTGRIA